MALFLDVDGTLLELADRPDLVRVPPGLIDSLQAVHERLGGALALISGRPLAQLDTLFAPLRLPAAGLHGLQVRGREQASLADDAPPELAAVLAGARALAARFPGSLIEDKGTALAFHWRAAGEGAGAEDALRQYAESVLPRLPGYFLQPGKDVVELRPGGAHKGTAVDLLMATPPFQGRTPVFVGDDLTDEHGFIAAAAHGGSAIVVGERRPTSARYGLRGPAEVMAWLGRAALAEAEVAR